MVGWFRLDVKTECWNLMRQKVWKLMYFRHVYAVFVCDCGENLKCNGCFCEQKLPLIYMESWLKYMAVVREVNYPLLLWEANRDKAMAVFCWLNYLRTVISNQGLCRQKVCPTFWLVKCGFWLVYCSFPLHIIIKLVNCKLYYCYE